MLDSSTEVSASITLHELDLLLDEFTLRYQGQGRVVTVWVREADVSAFRAALAELRGPSR